MNLKLRYGLFLLLVLFLLIISCIISVKMFTAGMYFSTLFLFAILYLSTFYLGKRFSKIFFVLSFLRLLRKNNGRVSIEKFNQFMDDALSGRKYSEARTLLKKEILTDLQNEEVISVEGEVILLLSPE